MKFLALLLLLLSEVEAGKYVKNTLVMDSVEEGAVCLDGSPPAYSLDEGSGSCIQNWLVFIAGGGWCSSLADCANRTQTNLGSSRLMNDSYFGGILSNSPAENPDFYNWNRVILRYCDGASFLGNVNEPMNFTSPSLQVQVTSRGILVWRALIKALLKKGMQNAEKALLAGCSAGGLSSITHCNNFKELLPEGAQVKCLSDAGFFIDTPDISGNSSFREYYKNAYTFHNVSEQLPKECTSCFDAKCFFPSYILPYVKVPLMLVNPGYDVWQIQNILIPRSLANTWNNTCRIYPSLENCTSSQLEVLQEFRLKFLKILNQNNYVSAYVSSCFTHCQTQGKEWSNVVINNKTIQEAVGSWYFENKRLRIIDSPYPSNPTCFNWKGWTK